MAEYRGPSRGSGRRETASKDRPRCLTDQPFGPISHWAGCLEAGDGFGVSRPSTTRRLERSAPGLVRDRVGVSIGGIPRTNSPLGNRGPPLPDRSEQQGIAAPPVTAQGKDLASDEIAAASGAASLLPGSGGGSVVRLRRSDRDADQRARIARLLPRCGSSHSRRFHFDFNGSGIHEGGRRMPRRATARRKAWRSTGAAARAPPR